METPKLLSGGADGSDYAFHLLARYKGHSTLHFSFPEHKTKVDTRFIKVLTENELNNDMNMWYLTETARILKKNFPPKDPYTLKLLQRNVHQVISSERVYAISTIKDNIVQGGTGWAVHLAKDVINIKEIYVFHQDQNVWYEWNTYGKEWIPTFVSGIPVPHGNYTGIGTRKINTNGIRALKELYRV